ncbi:hypothetical protein GJ496_008057 [Pomphorhynchus laevis]|nr:hypothetical protein GJ496_008057 [Pomphorhynchus laevis]
MVWAINAMKIKIKFFATTCGHLLCEQCIRQHALKDSCIICRTRCSVFRLSSKMNSSVEKFFLDPREILKRQANELNELLLKQQKTLHEVLTFQRGHRLRLTSYRNNKLTEINKISNDYDHLIKRYNEMTNENNRLRQSVENHDYLSHSKEIKYMRKALVNEKHHSAAHKSSISDLSRCIASSPIIIKNNKPMFASPFKSALDDPANHSEIQITNIGAQSDSSASRINHLRQRSHEYREIGEIDQQSDIFRPVTMTPFTLSDQRQNIHNRRTIAYRKF